MRGAAILMACASLVRCLFAESPSTTEPVELVTLRQEHLRAMQRATIPVLTAYARQLESQKFAFTRQGKPDAALAVEAELKEVTRQLQAADAAAARIGTTMQLTILSASYGSTAKKRFTDITKTLRKALETNMPTIKLNTEEGAAGVDPAPYTPKETTIVYTINGQRKQKTFPEGRKLDFKEDLQ